MTTPTAPAPLVVLVHGAWHGAWCWAALQARLDDAGIASLAIDLPGHGTSTAPLGDMYGDAQHVADVIDTVGRPVVLVGHSYGGAVITEAALRTPHVHHLVYLTAFALDQDETIMGAIGSFPVSPTLLGKAMVMRDDGTSVLDHTTAVPALYGCCTPAQAAAATQRLSPQPMVTFLQAPNGSPRDSIPSTYVVCSNDEAIAPAHQEIMATRCTATITLDTDHSPFVSMPADVARILADVVAGA
ncbi:MAG: alpha/beta hydrolase [Ilumatobacteraceae bacterium]